MRWSRWPDEPAQALGDVLAHRSRSTHAVDPERAAQQSQADQGDDVADRRAGPGERDPDGHQGATERRPEERVGQTISAANIRLLARVSVADPATIGTMACDVVS